MLLLGLTFLVVEAIVDRGRARQWQRAIEPTLAWTLREIRFSGVYEAYEQLAGGVAQGDDSWLWKDAARAVAEATGKVRVRVDQIQAALLAAEMHRLYALSEQVVQSCDMALLELDRVKSFLMLEAQSSEMVKSVKSHPVKPWVTACERSVDVVMALREFESVAREVAADGRM